MANENKWYRVGTIKKGKTGNQYLAMGTSKSKYEPVNVRLVVEDLSGKVLASSLNANLFLQNPRKRKGISEEDAAKIPEYVLAEVSLAPDRPKD